MQKKIAIHINGEKKIKMMKEVINEKTPQLPIFKVCPENGSIEWYFYR